MITFPQSELLLRRIRNRLTVRSIANRTFWTAVVLSGVYSVMLLAGRLTGLFPGWFSPWSVAIVPGLALLVAMLIPGRPKASDAARAIDHHHQTKDLFLTLLSLENSSSEYSPLVGRDAEKVAGSVKPEIVAPYQWEHRALVTAATLAVLLLGAFFVPTLDPFGKVANAKQEETSRKQLQATRKATEERRAQLANKDVEKKNSDATEQATEKLKADLRKMVKSEPKQNLALLNANQKEIGEMYRKLNSGELKSLFDKMPTNQKLGQLHDDDLFRKLQKELQEGNTEGLQKQLDELGKTLEKLANSTDPVEKSELQREVQKKLQELSDFASKKAGSKELNAALQRAMQQLESAKQEGLSQEAMEALKESLQLAEKEMQALGQAARDLKELEKALGVISMAKQMSPKEQVDGDMFDPASSLADYESFYRRLMEELGEGGEGEGMGNRGRGKGGVAPEDDSKDSQFHDEKSKSAIQKGKILLSLGEKGLSETGEVEKERFKAIHEIKQSLDEAIDNDQIPPGYIDSVKKYFDLLEKK